MILNFVIVFFVLVIARVVWWVATRIDEKERR